MSYSAPVRQADAETDKRAALKLAEAAARKADVTETTLDNALRFAAEQGASAREIAACTGLPEDNVSRALSRN